MASNSSPGERSLPFQYASSGSSIPLIPVDKSPTLPLDPRPKLSWIAPEGYAMFDAPVPRPIRAKSPSFVGGSSSRATSIFGGATSPLGGHRPGTSLSLNYLPSKFSDTLAVGPRNRRRPKDLALPDMARGGGVEAFRKGEARIAEDRDDEPITDRRKSWFDRSDKGLRWTRFKWVLFVFNLLYTVLGVLALIGCLLIWLNIMHRADVIRVAHRPELILSTAAAVASIFTAVFGWAGVVLNNRSFLALYSFLLWISFALLVVPGYLTYRHQTLNLEGKVNLQWSEAFDVDARRRIQDVLKCCGYFSPYIEASVSSACYARSILPGCKGPYLHFERRVLRRWYVVVFSLAAFHLSVIVAALLCSNHITYRFGKGMMPKAYRLDPDSVAVIMDAYASQIADQQYGPDAANATIPHPHSVSTDIDLPEMSAMPFSSGRDLAPSQARYGALNNSS